MYYRILIFLLILYITGCSARSCEFYSDLSNKDEEHPCNSMELDDQGKCHKLITCQDQSSCFASWRNESGNVTVEKKGCWLNSDCQSKCIDSRPDRYIFFCCCNIDSCNRNFYANATKLQNITESTILPPTIPGLSAVVIVLISITIICIIAICAAGLIWWCLKNKKVVFDEIEVDSLGTPSSGITTSSVATNLIAPVKHDFNLPQLIEMKARGRFGCVWKAQLKHEYVAVKTFCVQDKKSWLNEQDIFNTPLVANHENILRFIAAASRGIGVETELWLITEFHEQGSLADYLKIHTVSLAEALVFMKSMATGLAFLHEDILFSSNKSVGHGCKSAIAHRDFKSKNVLITNKKTAVIADFGLAVKFIPGESPGETHGQVGTRRYMAPEILEGAINFQRDAFLRIDIYAFALVLWEVISRCSDLPDGPFPTYLMPYEAELGQYPTIEEMQENVVDKKLRPHISSNWKQDPVIQVICETIEECWDHDVEARLSAGCVEERLNILVRRTIITPFSKMSIESNPVSSASLTNFIDVERQNQINAQLNGISYGDELNLLPNNRTIIYNQQLHCDPPPYESETNV